jgi:hypothetical protein
VILSSSFRRMTGLKEKRSRAIRRFVAEKIQI